jgi:hypothetical protein
MAKDEKNIDDILNKLVLLTEGAQELFPDGKNIILFELSQEDFGMVQRNFREIDRGKMRFKIDISGSEVVFINEKIYETEEKTVEEVVVEEPKKSIFKRLFLKISGRGSV